MHAHMCLACSKWQGCRHDWGRVSEVMRAERRQRARPQKACRLRTVRGFVSFASEHDGELLEGFEYNSRRICLILDFHHCVEKDCRKRKKDQQGVLISAAI